MRRLIEGRGCEMVVATLRQVADSDRASWATWNNLAVALLECAPAEPEQAGPALADTLEALEATTRSLSLTGRSAEALFNRALLLEALHARTQAAEAWRRYLEVDPDSGWAAEARAHLEDQLPLTVTPESPLAGRVPDGISPLRLALRARLETVRSIETPDERPIRALIEDAEISGVPDLAASAWRRLAYRTSLDGRFLPALDLYAEARRRFEALGDREEEAAVRVMRAEILDALERSEEALAELAAALPSAPRISDPWQRYSTYWVAANTVAGTAPSAALALWKEAAAACPEMPERPLCSIDARIRLARHLSDPGKAAAALDLAERELAQIPAAVGKDRTVLDIAVAEAEWLMRGLAPGGLEAAVELWARAIDGLEALGSPATVAEAHAAKATALERLGLISDARAELERALGSVRRWDQDQRVRAEAAEVGCPGALRQIFERLIALHLAAAGDAPSPSAFLLSEEMRDRLAPRLNRTLAPFGEEDLERASGAIPPGTAVVEYVVLAPTALAPAPRAVAWVLAESFFAQVPLPAGQDLGAALEETRTAAGAEDIERWQEATTRLWEILLSPVLAELPAGIERLVVVPDGELHGVPWRGLWNPTTGRYLDEELSVSLAPSVRMLLETEPTRPRRGPPRTVLSVGFEDFSALGLANLAAAAAEAGAVAGAYGYASANRCPVNDWKSLRRCLPGAEVVHLATHAAADSRRDGWSWLAMPEETVGLDKLWRELPPLPATRLVVLSACESAATASGGEGLGGLARPFLARGVEAVAGTLWAIDDSDAAALFPLFHEEYRRTGNPTESLRKAREEWAEWQKKPWAWGGVAVIQRTL